MGTQAHSSPPTSAPPVASGRLRGCLLTGGKLLVALVLALVLAELAMRALGMRLPPRTASQPSGVMQKVAEAEAPGVGTALRPDAVGETRYPGAAAGEERVVEYRINSAGLRDRLYARPKPDGVYRIALVGDSVTYGTGIPLTETAAKALERHLGRELPGRVEVLNCGVPATNTSQQVAHLAWRVLAFEPDLVLVVTTIVDASGAGVTRSPEDLEEPWEIGLVNRFGLTSGVYDDEHSTPAQKRMIALRRASVLVDFVAHHAYRTLYRRVQLANYHRDWEPDSSGVAMIRRALGRALALGREHGFELRVAMYPFLTALGDDYPFDEETARLARICAELGAGPEPNGGQGVVFYDLLEPLRGQNAAALQAHLHDRHPNGRANELVGAWLAARLLPDVRAALAAENE